jgi:hypothetical protein
MSRGMRTGLVVAGVAGLVLALAFCFRWSSVQDFWPWSGGSTASASSGGLYGYGSTASSSGDSGDLSRLSYYFISSILAAISVPVIWIGLTGEFAAATGGAINLTLMFSGLSVYIFQSYKSTNNERLLTAGLVCVTGAVASAVFLFWSRRFHFRDQRPLPIPVRAMFGFFIVVLVLVGGALILKRPNVFPWPLEAEVSVVYGWVFLGASTYFVYAFLVPRWHNACGQLLGFLAYDLVLILPFLDHFDTVADENRLSLIVYTAVVILSGLLAIYYLFVNPKTRLWRSSSPEPVLQAA